MSLYVGNKKYCVAKKVGINNQDLTVTTGGRYTPDEGYTGFGVVEVATDDITINPSTSEQNISASTYDLCGFDTITVNPVTSAIDLDIAPENILNGVEILGVEGKIVLDTTTINPSTSPQTINHPQNSGVDGGYKTITVNPVTSDIDSNITSANIKSGVTILGVQGTVTELKAQSKTITLSSPDTITISPDSTYNGLSSVKINSIPNVKASNIKSGVTILGVSGTVTELKGETLSITDSNANDTYTPSTDKNGFTSVNINITRVNNTTLEVKPKKTAQEFTVDGQYTGYKTVTVGAVTSLIDSNIDASNIKSGVTILDVTGTVTELKGETRSNESITSTSGNTFTPSSGKNGITSITVKPTNQSKTITATTSSQTINVPSGYSGFGTLTVNPVTSSIDSNISADNIKSGVTILGIEGSCVESNPTTATFSKNGTYTPTGAYNGFNSVTVSVPLVELPAITPSTSEQVFTHPNYGGYSTVTVNPVTASVDPDIVAGNIRDGVTILGVEGTYGPVLETKNVTPTTSQQILTPTEGKDGFSSVTVNAVTSSIDSDIKAENILDGVNILGVTGKIVLDSTTINPSTSSQTITHPKKSGVNGGYKSITVNPVTSAIDSNIVPSKILKDVTILGVTGTLDFSETKSVTPTTSQQVITPTTANGYSGLSSVTVNAVTSAIDADIIPSNILKGKNILGVNGNIDYSEEKTVTLSTSSNQNITPTTANGYCGLSKVVVPKVTAAIDGNISAGNIKSGVTILGVEGTYSPDLRTLVVDPSVESQVFTPEQFDGWDNVTISAVPASIDIDISPENIRSGIDVLGVVGTLVELKGETRSVSLTKKAGQTFTPIGSGKNAITSITVTPNNQAKTISPSTSSQSITVPSGYSGFGTLTVNPVTSAIDNNILATNIKSGVTILGVEGTVTELKGTTKTGTSKITSNGTYTPSNGFNGFTEVEVDVNTVNNQTLQTITTNGTYTPTGSYTGFNAFTVAVDTVNNTSLSITPSKTAQSHTAASPYTGYGTVTVSAVTSSIDNNITGANIKSGVTILGVKGTLTELKGQTKTGANKITTNGIYTPSTGYNGFTQVEVDINTVNNTTLSVTPTTSQQQFTASSPYTGYSTVTVNAVTSSIDSNIVASKIKSGVTILGVTGTVTELKGQTKSVSITNKTGNTFTPDSSYNGITSITVTPTNQAKTITATTSQQTIAVPNGYSGFGTLTVSAVTSSIDSNITAANIKSGVTILGVSGTCTQLVGETRSVSITSTSGNTFTPSSGKNGITSITVTPTNKAITVTPTTSSQSITVPSGYSGHGTITVNAVTNSIDSNITAGNIKKNVTILGVTGTYEPSLDTLSITENGTYDVPEGTDGYSSVTVNVPDNMDSMINGTLQEIESDVTTVRDYAFYYLVGLECVTLNNATYIGYGAFTNTGLKRLIINTNSVCQLNSTDTFNGTAIEGGTGYIFVPDNLVDSYKAATNWIALASQIRSLEDFPELFAWTNATYGTLYTTSETPSVGDSVYDANGEVITSLENNGYTLTNITIASYNLSARTLELNGTEGGGSRDSGFDSGRD